jgi:cysteine-rich secretory family protein
MRRLPILCAVLAAMLAAAAGLVQRPPVVVERWRPGPAPERSEAALRSTMIAAHDAARRGVGAAPLAWDQALARDAAAYAGTLARSGVFEHAAQAPDAPPQGENLWMGTRGAYSFAEMVGAWVDERRHFRRGRFPDVSRTGRTGDVGHYTQIIWPDTARFGCALASNAGNDYLVCRYSPAGNVVGEDPLPR